MSYTFKTRLGEQLYQLLPEVYRTRDKMTGQAGGAAGTEDLAKYLDAHGHLLDLIHATLEQQLRDSLPKSSQDWLLPYFAQLLAANIVSPDSKGRHAEIDHAVSWRQRKGTLKCAEEIAEAVGQMEVEIQEGWKRVAKTPRIGMPIISAAALDDTFDLDMSLTSDAILHPQLPAVMVDLRHASRAVEASAANPAAKSSNFGGVRQNWRQINVHGIPCFPNSFEDVSSRTADLRTPDESNGHYHHIRLLAYAPPPVGMFQLEPIHLEWTKRNDSLYEHLIEVKEENGVRIIRNKTERILVISNLIEDKGVEKDEVKLEIGNNYRVENIHFSGTLLLEKGQLELRRVEAGKLKVDTFSTEEPVMIAENCLFNELSVGAGIAKLDSCTILEKAILKDVDAMNCIFNDFKYNEAELITGKVQYSRIPSTLDEHFDHNNNSNDKEKFRGCTTKNPSWFGTTISYTNENIRENNGAGVLLPDCDSSICAGASDGREMGYFHNGRKGRPVRINGDLTEDNSLNLNVPIKGSYPLRDVIFDVPVKVEGGTLVLLRSAAPSLTVITELSDDENGDVIPSLKAKDCLFDDLTVAVGLARLEYCTVMKTAECKHLQASDCIFAESIIKVTKPNNGMRQPSFLNCVRYSNFPAGIDDDVALALRIKDENNRVRLGSNTMDTPIFPEFDYCTGDKGDRVSVLRTAKFGEPGYGVLDPFTPDVISFGAEDGGEMGAYHHKFYSLKAEAVLDKMREFLPVGIEPVLIQDARLLHVPPEQKNSEKSTGNGGGS